MKVEHLNIYNNLVKLTRNKKLYLCLKNNDTFSDRLIILLFHFGFFLQIYKNELTKDEAQELFDLFIRQLELSIREIGYGDVSVNKKMKDYVNLFYSILDKIDKWENNNNEQKTKLIANFLNLRDDTHEIAIYYSKYRDFLVKNSLKIFTKDILDLKF